MSELLRKAKVVFDHEPPPLGEKRSDVVSIAEQVVFDASIEKMRHKAGCGCHACHGLFDSEMEEIFYPDTVMPEVKENIWAQMSPKGKKR